VAEASSSTILLRVARLKAKATAVAEAFEEAQAELVKALHDEGKKTCSATTDTGEKVKGTLVEGTRVIINEPSLKKALGAAKWAKVVKQVLDKERLEAAITMGEVDPNVVAQNSEELPNKPYVRVSGDKIPEDAPDGPINTKGVAAQKRAAKKVVKPRPRR
jgi:hypothetical protein